MEADFMVRPAPLAIKIILLLFIFAGCNAPVKNTVDYRSVNQNDTALHTVNGLMYYSNQLFTGNVFSLFNGLKDTASLSSYLHGKENGTWREWYAPGKLKLQREFSNGNKTGLYTVFWENGNKQSEDKFLNDEYEGTCREWNSNGHLVREMNYVKGHEEGPQKMFYDNGKVRSNYVMINGRRFGLLGTKNCVNVSDSIFKK